MARLMSQIKGGYYAASPVAVAAVLERLKPPDRGPCLLLDPCAGEGQALVQLAEGLKAVPYGIELSEDRAALLRKSLPDGQSLAPADFLRCAISYRSFSFVWCNPPYDYATGEACRVESQFIERAAHLLADDGVLALVCPEDVANSYATAEFFEEHFYQISAMPFPEEVRKYKETVILGCKRKQPAQVGYGRHAWDWLEKRMEAHVVYKLPAGQRPRHFRKSEPTDTELARLVAQSPLRFHIERPADKAESSPPAADEPRHRPSGHALGERAHRRADLPGPRAAARHPGHGCQGHLRRLVRHQRRRRRQRHQPDGHLRAAEVGCQSFGLGGHHHHVGVGHERDEIELPRWPSKPARASSGSAVTRQPGPASTVAP